MSARIPGIPDDEALIMWGEPHVLAAKIADNPRVKRAIKNIEALAKADAGGRSGRPASGLASADIVLGLVSLLYAGRPAILNEVAEYLHCELDPEVRQTRGITRPWPKMVASDGDESADGSEPLTMPQKRQRDETLDELRRQERAAIAATERRFHSMTNPVGAADARRARPRRPRPPKGQKLQPATPQQKAADRQAFVDAYMSPTLAERERRDDMITDLSQAIIEASLDLAPASIRDRLIEATALGVDGTFIPTHARARKGDVSIDQILGGTSKPASTLSGDPEAGHYIRKYEDGESTYVGFGYEAHLAVAFEGGASIGTVTMPGLILGMSVGSPGSKPGEHAIRTLTGIRNYADENEWNPQVLATDSLYPGLAVDTFHRPLRQLGFSLVADLRKTDLGIKAEYEGHILVEGKWYCAQMPAALITATIDYRAGKITAKTYESRIAARRNHQSYRMNGSNLIDGDGQLMAHRLACAADRPTCPSACPRKPASQTAGRPVIGPAGGSGRTNLSIAAVNQTLPAACTQRTVTMPAEIGIRWEQEYPVGSPEWHALLSRVRSMNEGKNADAKDTAKEALAVKGRRRVNGKAENTLIAACSIAATNLRLMASFLKEARHTDEGLARVYPERPRRDYPRRDKRKTSPTRTKSTSRTQPTGRRDVKDNRSSTTKGRTKTRATKTRAGP